MTNTTEQRRTGRRGLPLRRLATLGAAAISAALLVGPAAEAASTHATSVVVSTTNNSKLGTLLVSGKTLYTLSPSKTACTAACLKVWPELVLPKGVKKATAGAGVTASKLGTVARAGGVMQVTYAGKALYWFIGDKKAGQVSGNITDTWGKWSDVVTKKAASGSGSGSGSGTNTGTGGVAF